MDNATQYQLLPPLPEDQYAALKADILARGVMVPIEKDESGNVLDGFHRLQICEELGVDDYPVIIRYGMSHEEKVDHALSLNLSRRHLTPEQRAQLHRTLRSSGLSYRAIAEKTGVDPVTVLRDVNSTVANSTVPLPERIVGRDGKSRPAIIATSREEERKATNILNLQPSRVIDSLPSLSTAEQASSYAMADKFGQVIATKWTGDIEGYTPAEYVEAVRRAMGSITTDPATTPKAQAVIEAETFYTLEDDGLKQPWRGNVFLNPPYRHPDIRQFIDKLFAEIDSGNVTQAILLTNNNTDTIWFHDCGHRAALICFTKGRINFYKPDDSTTSPTNGQTFFYFGNDVGRFASEFSPLGLVIKRYDPAKNHQASEVV